MKALLIIAQTGFQDVELQGVRDGLVAAGFDVILGSTKAGPCTGKFGSTEQATLGFAEIDLGEFDRVAYIGGPGAAALADDTHAQHLARSVVQSKKPLGAICIAPTILAKAGVLRGKKATVWAPPRSGQAPLSDDPIKVLEACGAVYTGDDVTADGLIVTGNGPEAAERFGKIFAALR